MAKKPHLSIPLLSRTVVRDFWRWRWKLVGLVAIIAVPLSVLSNLGLSKDLTFSAYSSLLSMVMNIALIWMVGQLKSGHNVSIRDAYYRGTGSLVRFVLLLIVMTTMFTPFLLGYSIYLAGVTGATLAPSLAERLLLAAVWLILSLPSVWLLTRFFLSIYALVIKDITPIEALKLSNKLVKGQTGKVMGRLLLVGVLCLVVLSMSSVALGAGVQNQAIAMALITVQALTIIVILPLASLFLSELFLALERE